MDFVGKLVVAVVIILLVVLAFSGEPGSGNKTETIRTLARQAARWSVAAAQDENAMVAVLHANYGAGYLWALRDVATDQEIEKATGIDVARFRDEITRVQDGATRRMARLCPEYAPAHGYLARIAGEI